MTRRRSCGVDERGKQPQLSRLSRGRVRLPKAYRRVFCSEMSRDVTDSAISRWALAERGRRHPLERSAVLGFQLPAASVTTNA